LPSLTVNYQAVGSGAGITALEGKTVDFGASDPPLKPAEESAIAKNGSPPVQVPMFLGAITVSYNVPGLTGGLKLDGTTLSHNFTYAAAKNASGQFVLPTLASTTAAAEGVQVPPNLGFKIKNPTVSGAYPITSQTFIVVNKDMCKAGVPGGEAAAKGVVKFLG